MIHTNESSPAFFSVWSDPEAALNGAVQADWDYFLSHMQILRTDLFEYGFVPAWTFQLCGLKSELANPQSWAFTWPSLFAYLFTPFWGLVMLWLAMAVVGYLATARFLLSHGLVRSAARLGAVVFVFSSYFFSHFNQGHMTFCLFYMVPLLLISIQNLFSRHAKNNVRSRDILFVVMAHALFFTAAMPHGLFYFYPAVVLYIASSIFWNQGRYVFARLALAISCVVIGTLVAGYKLYPVAQWQFDHPRKGVLDERYSTHSLILNLFAFIENHMDSIDMIPDQVWGYWEYHNFLGPVVVVVAIVGLIWKDSGRFDHHRAAREHLRWYAAILLAIGLLLSLGNKHPLGLPQLFSSIPVLKGIRVFSRFQILMTFGLVLAFARGIWVIGWDICNSHKRKWVLPIIGVLAIVPILLQDLYLVKNIFAMPSIAIANRFGLPEGIQAEIPENVTYRRKIDNVMFTYQTFFLRRGFHVLSCYEPMNLGWDRELRFNNAIGSLAKPIPEKVRYGMSEMMLQVPSSDDVRVWIPASNYLQLISNFADLKKDDLGYVYVEKKDASQKISQIHLAAHKKGQTNGVLLSIIGVLMFGVVIAIRQKSGIAIKFKRKMRLRF